jgi:folate-dependent phosphoribosylglycinamide formyltransferase PurN
VSLPFLSDSQNAVNPNSVKILGVLASGSGSNLEAIATAIENGQLQAKISVVIYNEPDAFAKQRAEKFGMGSWKKGQAGREANQMYRDAKKNNELYTQSVGAQKRGKDEKIKNALSKKK